MCAPYLGQYPQESRQGRAGQRAREKDEEGESETRKVGHFQELTRLYFTPVGCRGRIDALLLKELENIDDQVVFLSEHRSYVRPRPFARPSSLHVCQFGCSRDLQRSRVSDILGGECGRRGASHPLITLNPPRCFLSGLFRSQISQLSFVVHHL